MVSSKSVAYDERLMPRVVDDENPDLTSDSSFLVGCRNNTSFENTYTHCLFSRNPFSHSMQP